MALSSSGVEEKQLWPDSFPVFSDMSFLPSYPTYCVLEIPTTEVMTSSFPSVGSPKDSLALPVSLLLQAFLEECSCPGWLTAYMPGMLPPTVCHTEVSSQPLKGLIWKTISSSSVVLWKESNSSSPMSELLRMAGNSVNMEDPWKQVDLSRRFNWNLGVGYTK